MRAVDGALGMLSRAGNERGDLSGNLQRRSPQFKAAQMQTQMLFLLPHGTELAPPSGRAPWAFHPLTSKRSDAWQACWTEQACRDAQEDTRGPDGSPARHPPLAIAAERCCELGCSAAKWAAAGSPQHPQSAAHRATSL